MNSSLLLLYGRTNRHLGLWKDLEHDPRVVMRCVDFNLYPKLIRGFRRVFLSCIDKLRLPYRHMWCQHKDLFKIIQGVDQLLIIDGALNNIDICELEECRKLNSDLTISLYLINSVRAQSPVMRGVVPKMSRFAWDKIYTFDPEDAEEYGFVYLGFNYYSKQVSDQTIEVNNDIYFVGGLKGGREEQIYNIYKYLNSHQVKCIFDLMTFGRKDYTSLDGINYIMKWRPYNEVLQNVMQSKCILEINQKGQKGATLRYFEAITMNKKLLTNNLAVVDFPFYNSKWIKIIKSLDDIDLDWIKADEQIDYGYQGEFSPIHLIDFILENSKKNEKI